MRSIMSRRTALLGGLGRSSILILMAILCLMLPACKNEPFTPRVAGTTSRPDETGYLVGWGSQAILTGGPGRLVAIAAGLEFCLGLRSDGAIAACGINNNGQCEVPSPNADFIAIAAGRDFALGLKSDGTIVAWGNNDCGQCDVPPHDTGFVAIAAGDDHCLAIDAEGAIVAWGNGSCQIPEPNEDFISIAAGPGIYLALRSDHSIVVWGPGSDAFPDHEGEFLSISASSSGCLALRADGTILSTGIGTFSLDCIPQPDPDEDFISVEAGIDHCLALREDGSVVAWGRNDFGQCDVPEPNSGFIAITASLGSYALRSDSTAEAWGRQYNCSDMICEMDADFIAVAALDHCGMALKSDGTIVSFGYPLSGSQDPDPNTGFSAISLGSHLMALRSDGTALAWYGRDIYDSPESDSRFKGVCAGEWRDLYLDGNGTIHSTRVDSRDVTFVVPTPNSAYVAISAGAGSDRAEGHYLGLRSNGSIEAWGTNYYNQCHVPLFNRDFIAIAAGYCISLGLKADGRIVAWGNDWGGQCDVPEPNEDFAAIAASLSSWPHCLGLKADGSIVVWGPNEHVQHIPEPNSGYIAIAAGDGFSLALRRP
jgi:alpha-tubulin suppressor-like RCC1 family protein